VRIVWKHMPLAMHKDAPLAHLASMAAAEQGKFWEYHDKLFVSTTKLKGPDLMKHAEELGLDMKRFQDAIAKERGKSIVDADIAEAGAMGVTGTPCFFVNGRFLNGAKPIEEFAKLINAELQKLNIPIPADAPKG
jgi:predicted DsbA family dithiol-disulfide isomerase